MGSRHRNGYCPVVRVDEADQRAVRDHLIVINYLAVIAGIDLAQLAPAVAATADAWAPSVVSCIK